MKSISEDLFYKIRSRFQNLKLGKETGEITIDPTEAAFFDFDYMEGENPIGHISISLAEPQNMKVYYSTGITENMDLTQKDNWYKFLRELRQFAKRRLMSFDTRDIAKDNLDKRDFLFLSQTAQTNKAPVGESIMSESNLYGTKTMSFQKLLDTKLIIKHSQALTDDMAPGARSRNIAALFVQNEQGERFKYPFIHLAGARAMQRHVANGGLPYDDVGKSIIKMSEEIAQLKSFENYVVRNDLMNSDTNSIVERSTMALDHLREQVKKLSKQSHYEAYKASFQQGADLEVPQDVVEDFTEKFTVKNFKEDIKSVFPILYRLMKEQEQSSEIGYDDIVEMTAEEQVQEGPEDSDQEGRDPFDQFEAWVMGLGEASAITSQDEEEKAQAVSDLQELVGQHFPAGVDGTNAIQALKGIIEDPELYKQIKDQAKEDADSCVRPLVKQWLESNAPDVVGELDFGDMTEPEAEEPAAQEQPVTQSDDNKTRGEGKLNIQELAEFIQSFYDKESGTFPKGPEGVAIMVGKKFGEQAESVARKFVERMAPMQTTEQNPELAELARIKELSGVRSSQPVTQEAEGSDDQEGPADLLAAVEEEINNPGGSVDNLRDVMNATIDADDSPEFEKARAVINGYLDLVDNAEMGSEEDGIAPMRDGNIRKHIADYDLTDRLAHAAAMLDKIAGVGEGLGRELGNTPRDNLIKHLSPTVMDNDTLMKAVKKAVNSPEFTSDFILKIVDAGDSIRHPLGKFIQKEFEELQYDMGRRYEDYPEQVADQLITNLTQMVKDTSTELESIRKLAGI